MAFLAPAALFIAGNIAAAGLFYGASKVLDYATGNSYYAQKAEQNKEKEEERLIESVKPKYEKMKKLQ